MSAAARLWRARIIGFQSTVINLAYAVGPAVGGYLCDLYGARLMFFIVGGAAAISSAGFCMLGETFQSSSTYSGYERANLRNDCKGENVRRSKNGASNSNSDIGISKDRVHGKFTSRF